MKPHIPTRQEAYDLLTTHTKSEALINHAKSVEAVMRRLAGKYSEDPEKWGVIGLIHDIDYEEFPGEHCRHAPLILREVGWPVEYIRAVESHGWDLCTAVKPETNLEKALYAIDELTGLVAASALVRPSRSVMDLEASSVKKKWKQPSFAASANREVIARGADMLGMPLEELITETILGMRTVAKEIEL